MDTLCDAVDIIQNSVKIEQIDEVLRPEEVQDIVCDDTGSTNDVEVYDLDLSAMEKIDDSVQVVHLYLPSQESYKCLTCKEIFTSIDSLNTHVCLVQPKASFRELHAVMTQTDDSILQLQTEGEVIIDLKSIGGDVAESTSTYTIQASTKTRVAGNPKRNYNCEICFKSFISASKLNRHRLHHTGEKPHECNICNRRFTQLAHLKVHMELHTGEYVYRKLLECAICGKTFSSRSNMQTHMVIHSGVKRHKCDQCNRSFALISHLKRHLFSHTGEKPYSCESCKKTFTTKFSMKVHMKQHTGEGIFRCETCDKYFYDKSHLKRHQRVHMKLKNLPYKCHKCVQRFADIFQLNSHLNVHKPKSNLEDFDVRALVQSVKQSAGKSQPKVRKYRTQQPLSPSLPVIKLPAEIPPETISDENNPDLEDLSKEKDKNVKNKCPICGKGFAHPSNLLKHKKTVHASVRAYQCDICHRTFTQNAHLKVHKKTLHAEPGEQTLYQCGVCSKQFNVQRNAERHMQTIHLGQKKQNRLQCTICNKTFQFPVLLKRHLLKHESEERRECQICKKTFISEWHYDMHYRTHTGEKPYHCELCDLKFGDKSTLTRHNRSVHANTPHETCHICKRTYSSKAHLVKHLKNHPETRQTVLDAEKDQPVSEEPASTEKYQCGKCFKSFIRFTSAWIHMKVHSDSNEIPLKCPFCYEDFANSREIVKHIRSHTGESEPIRKQVCNFCNKKFISKKALKTHLMNKHKQSRNDNIEMVSSTIVKQEPLILASECGDGEDQEMEEIVPNDLVGEEESYISHDGEAYIIKHADGHDENKEMEIVVIKQEPEDEKEEKIVTILYVNDEGETNTVYSLPNVEDQSENCEANVDVHYHDYVLNDPQTEVVEYIKSS